MVVQILVLSIVVPRRRKQAASALDKMPARPPARRKLPEPLPEGMLLMDLEKKCWKLGRKIGQGGFGLIYLAFPQTGRPVGAEAEHVIKVEYYENGPLFTELKFYQRAAKPEDIKNWMKEHCVTFLGIPPYWGSGFTDYKGKRYRFMVMDRLGTDLQHLLEMFENRFPKTTVMQIGIRMLDVLKYIHEHEYVHGDIKAANLLLGYRDENQVYLADYGLCYRYCPNGNHREYKKNPKKAHNGTIEFTSLDAHYGVDPSRRSDLEILGYCMLQWLCGELPWEKKLQNCEAVQNAKTRFMENLPHSVKECFPRGLSCDGLADYFQYVKHLDYDEIPSYEILKGMLSDELKPFGISDWDFLKFSPSRYNQNTSPSRQNVMPEKTPLVPHTEAVGNKPPFNCQMKTVARVNVTPSTDQLTSRVRDNQVMPEKESTLATQTKAVRSKPAIKGQMKTAAPTKIPSSADQLTVRMSDKQESSIEAVGYKPPGKCQMNATTSFKVTPPTSQLTSLWRDTQNTASIQMETQPHKGFSCPGEDRHCKTTLADCQNRISVKEEYFHDRALYKPSKDYFKQDTLTSTDSQNCLYDENLHGADCSSSTLDTQSTARQNIFLYGIAVIILSVSIFIVLWLY